MTIKKTIFFAFLMFLSCDQLKTEDEKIRDILIGRFYEDDRNENGIKVKDIKGEFFSNGKFIIKETAEIEDTDVQLKMGGKWDVKDGFIYYKFDFNSIKITPEIYMSLKDKLINEIKTRNTPDRVIEYDAQKIIYKDSDGNQHTMKKSY